MFVNPCIIVQFLQKTQQDATVYRFFIIPYFKGSSTCFGRHTAQHQESKTAQAASDFVQYCGKLSDVQLLDVLRQPIRCLTTSNSCRYMMCSLWGRT